MEVSAPSLSEQRSVHHMEQMRVAPNAASTEVVFGYAAKAIVGVVAVVSIAARAQNRPPGADRIRGHRRTVLPSGQPTRYVVRYRHRCHQDRIGRARGE